MLPQFREKSGDVWVLKILCDDRELEIPEAPDEADKFEVAEMRCDPDSACLPGQSFCGWVIELDLDMFFPIGGRETACPEQVDESAGKVLVRSPGDDGSLPRSVLITEGGAQVFQGRASAARVRKIGDGPYAAG